MYKIFLYALFILSLLAIYSVSVRAEYTETEVGTWFALLDDTVEGGFKTAYIAKNSFNRHVTNFVMDSTTIHIGCEGPKRFIFFDFDVPIKSSGGKIPNVEYQIDEGKTVKAKWNLAANLKALLVPKPESFIKTLIKAEQIMVKIEKANSPESVQSYFNISDLRDSFKFVQDNCRWK
jgi:hypothetical protein